MNALLIYPEFPDTYWSFKHALKFLGKRAAKPPLGQMTAAAPPPKTWKKRLIDTSVERLRDHDLEMRTIQPFAAFECCESQAARGFGNVYAQTSSSPSLLLASGTLCFAPDEHLSSTQLNGWSCHDPHQKN